MTKTFSTSFIKRSNKKTMPNWVSGFTLIELLLVVAIIGILSGVVIASLNSAREKGRIGAIKSNLRSMIAQAELAYDAPGNYSTVCTTGGVLQGMIDAITNSGGTAKCYSHTQTGDVYQRWGVSARLNSDTTKNFSVDQNGVVTWDTSDAPTTKNWNEASTYCASVNGHLPSLEQLKALSLAYGSTTPTDAGFVADYYWVSTVYPTGPGSAYAVVMTDGSVSGGSKTVSSCHVRCVH